MIFGLLKMLNLLIFSEVLFFFIVIVKYLYLYLYLIDYYYYFEELVNIYLGKMFKIVIIHLVEYFIKF